MVTPAVVRGFLLFNRLDLQTPLADVIERQRLFLRLATHVHATPWLPRPQRRSGGARL
jgi:hypothetical protein